MPEMRMNSLKSRATVREKEGFVAATRTCETDDWDHFRNLEARVMLGFEDHMDRCDFDVLRHSLITTVGIQEAMIIIAM